MSSQGDLLGVDIYAVDDMEPTCRLVWGKANLEAALLRRLQSREGCLVSIGGDPDYGYDVPGEMNDDGDPGTLAGINAQAQNEIEKDPRVQSASTQIVSTVEAD